MRYVEFDYVDRFSVCIEFLQKLLDIEQMWLSQELNQKS